MQVKQWKKNEVHYVTNIEVKATIKSKLFVI